MLRMKFPVRRCKRESTMDAGKVPWTGKYLTSVCKFSLYAIAALIFSSSLLNTVWSQESSSAQDNSSSDYTLKINADMVILNATVLDHHNALVSGLDKDDFQVYEDHVLQRISHFSHEDIPVTVGVVVDNSGSMASKRADRPEEHTS